MAELIVEDAARTIDLARFHRPAAAARPVRLGRNQPRFVRN
jgi:hypothetical protein